MSRFFLCLLLLGVSFSLCASSVALQPPKGWNCISDTDQLPQKVCRLYIGSGTSQFSPSINIACEPTSLSDAEYLAMAKSYHEATAGTRCQALGTIETTSGTAQLLQIDRPTEWGNVRFIQATLLDQQTAYVITATCLQKEFASLSSKIFKSIKSFSIQPENRS